MKTKIILLFIMLIPSYIFAGTNLSYNKQVNIQLLCETIYSSTTYRLMKYADDDITSGHISMAGSTFTLHFDIILSTTEISTIDNVVESHVYSTYTATSKYYTKTPAFSMTDSETINQKYLFLHTPRSAVFIGTTTMATASINFVELMRTTAFPAPFAGWGEARFYCQIEASLPNT